MPQDVALAGHCCSRKLVGAASKQEESEQSSKREREREGTTHSFTWLARNYCEYYNKIVIRLKGKEETTSEQLAS